MLEILQYQVRYAAWANARILAAAGELSAGELERDFGTADKSVSGTLAHIYRAERVWLGRIKDVPTEFQVAGDDAFSALRENWPLLSQQWVDWCGELRAEEPVLPLTYKDLKQNTWTQPLWKIVLHVVNHSTHHRGQVAGFLRALGRVPPSLDSITFARLGEGQR